MTTDYKSTLLLPRTDFPMKAGLPAREPVLLERWQKLDLWRRLRDDAKGRQKFTLHDGPPYANGPLHNGHALNKILKDIVNRTQQMSGRDAHFIPGWDCHGLPIEWQIEQDYRKQGRDKDSVPVDQFRRECRAYADRWIEVQMAEFQRLAVLADWDRRYLTMDYAAEAQIVREAGKFLMNGGLYRGSKPVMWSPVEKTALAEAEVEYRDVTSPAVFVRFPVTSTGHGEASGESVVIWTTTPWTLPGNQAVAYHPEMAYGLYEVTAAEPGSHAKLGEKLLIAQSLAGQVAAKANCTLEMRLDIEGNAFHGWRCRHPFGARDGQPDDVPMLAADFVTAEQGSGFVHIAPGHGTDDFELGREHSLPVPETVADDGCFLGDVPLFAGQHVYKVNPVIIDALAEQGGLVAKENYRHPYPHSWRSKKPVIFRNTPQWFIGMDLNHLRETALKAIDDTRWLPASGRNRIRAMVENRPDWCVSRQRAWGVPIPVFVERATGEPLRDAAVIERIADAVAEGGADVWFTADPATFLGPDRDPADYEQVRDILDVWFDSGSTHSFVLEGDETQTWPAALYLEGTDQHRGWFHSSLLEACGTRGRAPYEAVLTHGFVLDGDGLKMSKSVGNTVTPQAVIKDNGADILRLWVSLIDYTEDMRFGPETLKGLVDSYRRLRNTLRFMLGNLADFDPAERVDVAQLPELERWVLHRLSELDGTLRGVIRDYDFHTFYNALHGFCASDLSAFYFDMRKDALYCDSAGAERRRAARTVLDIVFDHLTAWLAPVLAFTAEEAWLARHPSDDDSVHLRQFPEVPAAWRDEALAEKWERVRALRRVMTGALEVERREKRIGASLQARIEVFVGEADAALLAEVDVAELAITSAAKICGVGVPEAAFTVPETPDVGVLVHAADGEKCGRCWRILPSVGSHGVHPDLCTRCHDAVAALAD